MGLLVDGIWRDQWYDTKSTGGRFVRQDSAFRNWITPDGSPGPTGDGGFEAEPGRYHLYVSLACPWAHRTLIFRRLKGLEDATGDRSAWPETRRRHGRPPVRLEIPVRDLRSGQARLQRPRDGSGALGP